MISTSQLEIVDQASEDKEQFNLTTNQTQTHDGDHVNSITNIKQASNQCMNNDNINLPPIKKESDQEMANGKQNFMLDQRSKKILMKSLGQLNQLQDNAQVKMFSRVYSPYQIDDNSANQIVLNQLVQEELKYKHRGKKRQHTRGQQKLESSQELKSHIENLKNTFANRKASQIQTNYNKDPIEPMSGASITKHQMNKKYDYNSSNLQFSPYDVKFKTRAEPFMNHTQTTGFGMNQSEITSKDKSRINNILTVHPLSSAGSSGTYFNQFKQSQPPTSAANMSQSEYIKELELKLQVANEKILQLQNRKQSSGRIQVFHSPKRLTSKNSMESGSLNHIEQFLANRINSSLLDDVHGQKTDRIDSKQYQEPDAEDKGEDYLIHNIDRLRDAHNNSVSNDSNRSSRNYLKLSGKHQFKHEVGIQTRDTFKAKDQEIQVNIQTSFKRQQNSIIHQLSTFRDHQNNNVSFESGRFHNDPFLQPSKEEDLQNQNYILSQQVDFLKEQVMKKDRDMRVYYDEILHQARNLARKYLCYIMTSPFL
eukprot:403347543